MLNYYGTFYFGEFKPQSSNTRVMPIKDGIVSIFTPFNFVEPFQPYQSVTVKTLNVCVPFISRAKKTRN